MKNDLRKMVLEMGADLCGFAAEDRFKDAPDGFHPTDLYKDCRSVIVFGISIPKGLAYVEPRLIYGHYNYFTCPEVDRVAVNTAKLIENQYGGIAVPLPCDGPYEYWDAEQMEGRGLLSMKHAAVQAGLGTLGKNTLLMNKEYGNRLTIGVVLTNLSIASDELADSICIEGCRLCIDSCPVGALNGESVKQKACRPNVYGKTKRGFDTVDCNQCRMICPRRFGVTTL